MVLLASAVWQCLLQFLLQMLWLTRLSKKLTPKIQALKIGPATDPASEMGPLVTAQHLQKVTGYIDAGEREGADVIVDGRSFRQDKQGI